MSLSQKGKIEALSGIDPTMIIAVAETPVTLWVGPEPNTDYRPLGRKSGYLRESGVPMAIRLRADTAARPTQEGYTVNFSVMRFMASLTFSRLLKAEIRK